MTAEPAGFEPAFRLPERTIAELIAEKHAQPIESVEDFMEVGVFESDEEVDDFVATVREWRNASLA